MTELSRGSSAKKCRRLDIQGVFDESFAGSRPSMRLRRTWARMTERCSADHADVLSDDFAVP
ncbi:MAG TPA: hypothetical protein VF051_02400, partial [Hyphomicrobiaceae bacterium]